MTATTSPEAPAFTPHPYFIDKAREALARAKADVDADPLPLARFGQAAKERGQRTGGVLVTSDGTVIVEYHRSPGAPGVRSADYVNLRDVIRLTGEDGPTVLDLAQTRIRRALGRPVAAVPVSALCLGAGRKSPVGATAGQAV